MQLDLFYDYRTNAALYDTWQASLRERQPLTLIFWGQGDIFFTPAGGEAYLRDLPDAELVRLDSGHFAVEDNLDDHRREDRALLRLAGAPGRGHHPLNHPTTQRDVTSMSAQQQESDGATRVAYILGVPLAADVVRQWPQMGEIVRTRQLIAEVEGNFPELTLEVGRRHRLDDVVVVEWTCNYGDGRLYRNVTIGELEDGEVVRVTDYWGEPTTTPEWRVPMTERLDMPADGTWPANAQLSHH